MGHARPGGETARGCPYCRLTKNHELLWRDQLQALVREVYYDVLSDQPEFQADLGRLLESLPAELPRTIDTLSLPPSIRRPLAEFLAR